MRTTTLALCPASPPRSAVRMRRQRSRAEFCARLVPLAHGSASSPRLDLPPQPLSLGLELASDALREDVPWRERKQHQLSC